MELGLALGSGLRARARVRVRVRAECVAPQSDCTKPRKPIVPLRSRAMAPASAHA